MPPQITQRQSFKKNLKIICHNNYSIRFFRNTAAVAGVFILVGLAVASIILWIFFAIRSRRRTLRLDHDSAVSATLAAAGFHRAPLDDDDDPGESSRRSRYGSPDAFLHHRRSSSGLAMSSVGRASAAFPDPLPFHDDNDPHNFNPYSDYILPAGSRDAYVPSPPTSSVLADPYRTRSYSNTMGENTTAHAPQHSGGSHEPLLSSYNRVSLPPSPIAVTPPPQRLLDAPNIPLAVSDKPQQTNTSVTSSVYSTESIGDHRLDPNLRQRLQDDANLLRDLRDEDDYSRPVLGVSAILRVNSYSVTDHFVRFETCLMLQIRRLYDNTLLSLPYVLYTD